MKTTVDSQYLEIRIKEDWVRKWREENCTDRKKENSTAILLLNTWEQHLWTPITVSIYTQYVSSFILLTKGYHLINAQTGGTAASLPLCVQRRTSLNQTRFSVLPVAATACTNNSKLYLSFTGSHSQAADKSSNSSPSSRSVTLIKHCGSPSPWSGDGILFDNSLFSVIGLPKWRLINQLFCCTAPLRSHSLMRLSITSKSTSDNVHHRALIMP